MFCFSDWDTQRKGPFCNDPQLIEDLSVLWRIWKSPSAFFDLSDELFWRKIDQWCFDDLELRASKVRPFWWLRIQWDLNELVVASFRKR